MISDTDISGYRYPGARLGHAHAYLFPAVLQLLEEQYFSSSARRLFELGCGNGSVAHMLSQRGWDVTGIDPSREGTEQAIAAYPKLNLETWTVSTLGELLREAGFSEVRFERVGRFPTLAKSMIAIARKQ